MQRRSIIALGRSTRLRTKKTLPDRRRSSVVCLCARARLLARFLFPVDWEASLQVLPPAPHNTRYALSVAPEARSGFIASATTRRERASERDSEREIGATAAAADFSYWYGMAAERRRGGGGAADTRTRDGLQQQQEEQRCVALQLPCDMSRRIFSQLDCRDLMHCSLVCKQWRNESAELREGWREECWAEKSVRGLLVNRDNKRARPLYDAYLAGSPD